MHACLEEQYLREENSFQFISIKGEMVDDQYVEEKSIPEFLSKTILDLLTSSPHIEKASMCVNNSLILPINISRQFFIFFHTIDLNW